LYEYDVKITPATTARRLKKRIFELLEDFPAFAPYKNFVAHDGGAKMIAAKELPQPMTINDVPYFDEDEDAPAADAKSYSFEINFVQVLDLATLGRYVSS
jgi:hypothetical protein